MNNEDQEVTIYTESPMGAASQLLTPFTMNVWLYRSIEIGMGYPAHANPALAREFQDLIHQPPHTMNWARLAEVLALALDIIGDLFALEYRFWFLPEEKPYWQGKGLFDQDPEGWGSFRHKLPEGTDPARFGPYASYSMARFEKLDLLRSDEYSLSSQYEHDIQSMLTIAQNMRRS